MRGRFFPLFLLAFFCGCIEAAAQTFAYIYIQGDKKTPFYVKLDGVMAPRYGKNYCILSQLAAGATRIQILFQQNAYPAQDYTILVPDGGSRSFMLTQKEGTYQLYDIEQQFYLAPGNSAEDDHMPAGPAAVAVVTPPPTSLQQPRPVADAPRPAKTQRPAGQAGDGTKKPVVKKGGAKTLVPKPIAKKPAAQTSRPAASGEPAFIGGLELDNNSSSATTGRSSEPAAGSAAADRAAPPAASIKIINSDCPAPISTEEFSALFAKLGGRTGDEEKLGFLSGQMDKCYESWQARSLAGALEGDAARYTLLRKIYPRITDQEAFPLLDDVLTTEVYKAEFHRLVRPQ